MRSTSTLLIALAACAAAACGSDAPDAPDAASPDARPIDARLIDAPRPDAGGPLGCLGEHPPAGAPDPIALEGQLLSIVDYQTTTVVGATVELRRGGDGGVITTAITGEDGRFTMSAASGGQPLDAWFAIATAGRLPTHAFPGAPLVGGEDAFLLVADATEVARWYADAGTTYAAGLRTVIASVKDCANASPGGVTAVAAPAPARVSYYDPAAQHWTTSLTASPNGFVLLAGAAAALTVTPSIDATALPARALAPAADALTLLVASPRAPD